MLTLDDYVRQQFPEQRTETLPARTGQPLELTDHTVVAQVLGVREGLDTVDHLRRTNNGVEVGAIIVRTTPPTVVPDQPEDTDGIVDLPERRLTGAAALGFVIGAAGTMFATFNILPLAGAVICAVMIGLLGAFIASMFSGLGRFAGERATTQPNIPGRSLVVLGVFTDDEARAVKAVRQLEDRGIHDIRLVGRSGEWRSPST